MSRTESENTVVGVIERMPHSTHQGDGNMEVKLDCPPVSKHASSVLLDTIGFDIKVCQELLRQAEASLDKVEARLAVRSHFVPVPSALCAVGEAVAPPSAHYRLFPDVPEECEWVKHLETQLQTRRFELLPKEDLEALISYLTDGPSQYQSIVGPNDGPSQYQSAVEPNNGLSQYQSAVGPNDGPSQYQSAVEPNDGLSQYQSAVGPNNGPSQYQSAVGPNDGPSQYQSAVESNDGPSQCQSDAGPSNGQSQYQSPVGLTDGPFQNQSAVEPNNGPSQYQSAVESNDEPSQYQSAIWPNEGSSHYQPAVGPNQGLSQVQFAVGPNQGPSQYQPAVGPNQGLSQVQFALGLNQGPSQYQSDVGPSSGPSQYQPAVGPNQGPFQDQCAADRKDFCPLTCSQELKLRQRGHIEVDCSNDAIRGPPQPAHALLDMEVGELSSISHSPPHCLKILRDFFKRKGAPCNSTPRNPGLKLFFESGAPADSPSSPQIFYTAVDELMDVSFQQPSSNVGARGTVKEQEGDSEEEDSADRKETRWTSLLEPEGAAEAESEETSKEAFEEDSEEEIDGKEEGEAHDEGEAGGEAAGFSDSEEEEVEVTAKEEEEGEFEAEDEAKDMKCTVDVELHLRLIDEVRTHSAGRHVSQDVADEKDAAAVDDEAFSANIRGGSGDSQPHTPPGDDKDESEEDSCVSYRQGEPHWASPLHNDLLSYSYRAHSTLDDILQAQTLD